MTALMEEVHKSKDTAVSYSHIRGTHTTTTSRFSSANPATKEIQTGEAL